LVKASNKCSGLIEFAKDQALQQSKVIQNKGPVEVKNDEMAKDRI
jgi:hypothetical protein